MTAALSELDQSAPRVHRSNPLVPVGLLLLVLLPLLLMPLASVFIFAFNGGLAAFVAALNNPDAQFALRFSLVIAFITAALNAVLGTFAAYVLSKYRFPGARPLGIVVNLPVAIPTVVVGTSLLLLWGPIGLLGRLLDPLGIQPMFTPAGVLLAHLFVTFPYMLGVIKPQLDELEATYENAAYAVPHETAMVVAIRMCTIEPSVNPANSLPMAAFAKRARITLPFSDSLAVRPRSLNCWASGSWLSARCPT